jgi:hypothetical protein
VLVALPHSRGLGVSGDEIWVVQMRAREEEAMNSSLFLAMFMIAIIFL